MDLNSTTRDCPGKAPGRGNGPGGRRPSVNTSIVPAVTQGRTHTASPGRWGGTESAGGSIGRRCLLDPPDVLRSLNTADGTSARSTFQRGNRKNSTADGPRKKSRPAREGRAG